MLKSPMLSFVLLSSVVLLAGTFSSVASAKCRVGQSSTVVYDPRLTITFCGGPKGAPARCRSLNGGEQVRIKQMCNPGGQYLGTLCLRPEPNIVTLPPVNGPKEIRDSSGQLVGCGIEYLPEETGTLKLTKVQGAVDANTGILSCEFDGS